MSGIWGRNSRLRKAILVLVFAELAYLVLVNAVLKLPFTQTVVNEIRPEKFSAYWENAWTWYPFRVHVTGLSANGQSRSQQWQLEVGEAAASIALLPLVLKRAWISDVLVTNVEYRQRPRLKEGTDYTAVMPFFPEIDGRSMAPAITTPRKKKRPWHIALDNIKTQGEYSFWIYQARASGRGNLWADLTFQTQGGPFSLQGNKLDLQLEPLLLNGDHEVFTHGIVSGELSFDPFVPRENRGVALLRFLSLDVDVDFDLNSLDFLNLFLLNVDGMSVDGQGQVAGRLHYERGDVRTGTALSVDARDLRVGIMSHLIEGAGAVNLGLGPQTGGQFDLSIRYEDLEVRHTGDSGVLLAGQGLKLSVGGDGRILPDPQQLNPTRSLTLEIEELTVPDLSLLERYFPQKWPFRFYGGNGRLQGRASIAPSALNMDVTLVSSGADLGIRDYRFDTNLDLALKVDNPSVNTSSTDISGSYIRLSNASLRKEGVEQADDWNASIVINDGSFSARSRDRSQEQALAVDLLRGLSGANSRQLLDNASASLNFEAVVSSLAWIGVLFKEDYGINVAGSGNVEGVIEIASGWPAEGTEIAVSSNNLAVNVLDYISRGDGRVSLKVKEGEQHPDWFLDIALADADFKRASEAEAYIQDVELNLAAVIPNVSVETEVKASSLDFRILSATVSDMSTFNAYLPPDGSIHLAGGTADLTADIKLHSGDAGGWLRLQSSGLEATVAEQSVSADLALEVLLVGGIPANMTFDIAGSSLRLDNVHVQGEKAQFEGDYWSAVFELQRGETTWTKPVRLDLEAALSVSDSRPLVAMFENKGRRPEFLSRMLTVRDIEGTASLQVADEKMHLLNAHAISDHLEIAAKGLISANDRDAMLYLRYKKADGLLKFHNDSKNLDIIGVKKKFDEFEPANVVPQGAPHPGSANSSDSNSSRPGL
jgi:hypothetical protein